VTGPLGDPRCRQETHSDAKKEVRELNTFNLIDQPWIPVQTADGTTRKANLRDVLVFSHELVSVAHPSPLVTVAVHRLLLAILHRNFGPPGTTEWTALWKNGRWDGSTLDSYFAEWRDRFDLFGPTRPFYQVPPMEGAVLHPPEQLVQEAATGNNPTLFDHSREDAPTPLTPGEAACYLLAQQCFAIGFGKSSPFYFSDAPLVRGVSVLILGGDGYRANLFETLALNLRDYAGGTGDIPAWEVDEPPTPRAEGTIPAGYLDYLTWQSRRINLIASDDGAAVTGCRIQQNLRLGGDFTDPFKAYRIDEKRGRVPVPLSPEKALWRQADSLFQLSPPGEKESSRSGRPYIFDWAAQARGRAKRKGMPIRDRYRFGAYGMATDPGKAASVLLWRQETLPLPLDILDDPSLSENVGQAIGLAEEVGGVLRAAARDLCACLLASEDDIGGRQAHPDDQKRLSRHFGLERTFWAVLGGSFPQLVSNLPDGPDEAMDRWLEDIDRAARAAFHAFSAEAGTSARALKAIVRAERTFRSGLVRVTRRWKEEGAVS